MPLFPRRSYRFDHPPEAAADWLSQGIEPITIAARKPDFAYGRVKPTGVWLAWSSPSPQWLFFFAHWRRDGEQTTLEGRFRPSLPINIFPALWVGFMLYLTARFIPTGTLEVTVVLGGVWLVVCAVCVRVIRVSSASPKPRPPFTSKACARPLS